MPYNFCLPIVVSSLDESRKMIEDHLEHYSYFEIWLDYIKDLSITDLLELVEDYEEKLVILFRRKQLEPIQMEMSLRQELIKLLTDKNLYLDLDLSIQQEEIDFFIQQKRTLKLLLSYHNYERTPSDAELEDIQKRMFDVDPAIYKITTFCHKEMEATRLLQLLLTFRKEHQKAIVLGMGEHGAITRVFGALWGNEMNFAPESVDAATAPGQFVRTELVEILEKISKS